MLSRTRRKARQNNFHYSDLPAFQTSDTPSFPVFEPSCEKVKVWWDHPAKVKMLCGANRSGKSITGSAYLVNVARSRPGSLSWAVALTFEMTGIIYELMENYFLPEEVERIIWASAGKGIPHSILFKNGSKIVFKSMDSGFRKFEGAKVDGVIMLDEECPSKKIFTSCLARTTGTQGQIILTMTPLAGKTWAYYDVFEQADGDRIYADTLTLFDNKFLDQDDIDFIVGYYSEEEYEYRVLGKWAQLTGRIYKAFRRDVHVVPLTQDLIDSFDIIFRGIDFGRWKAVTWCGLDHHEAVYVFAEWKEAEYTIEQMASEIRRIETELGIEDRIHDTITDHAFQERFELLNHGIACTLADKKVELGIEIGRRRFSSHNGKPTLFVCDTCRQTIAELEEYVYDEKKPIPKKGQDDHLCDTVRYELTAIDTYCSYRYGIQPTGIESVIKGEIQL